jgi:hypothetical protein
MKRLLATALVAFALAACGGHSDTGTAHDVTIENLGGGLGSVVRFTIDAPADCVITGHGTIPFPAGVNSYDVPTGTTLGDDPVWCHA